MKKTMRVECEVEEVVLENDEGREIDGVRVVCDRCGHCTESLGTTGRSVRRCLVLLREECPRHEENFYVVEDDEYGL